MPPAPRGILCKLLYNRLVVRALVVSNIVAVGRAVTDSIPNDTTLCRTCSCTCRLVVVTYTFDTLVAVYVVSLFTRRVIVFVNNGFNRTLVDTSTTVDTCIGNQNCHEVSCFWFRQTIPVRFLNTPKNRPSNDDIRGFVT